MALKDITQTIRINAQTYKAIIQLDKVQKQLKEIGIAAQKQKQKTQKAMKDMQGSFTALGIAAVAAFATIKRGLQGIGEDQASARNVAASIRQVGLQADLSAQKISLLADSLQTEYGQSAAQMNQAISRLITQGMVRTTEEAQNMMKQLLRISYQTGKDVATVSQRLVNDSIRGNTRLFKSIGMQVDTFVEGIQQLIQDGGNSLQFININDVDIQLKRLNQSFDNVLKQLAMKVLPVLTPIFNFINNNIKLIGDVLLTGGIYTGMKLFVNSIKAANTYIKEHLAYQTLMSAQSLLKVQQQQAKYNLLISKGATLTAGQTAAYQRNAILLDTINAKQGVFNGLLTTAKTILSSINFWLLAISVAFTVISSNWDKWTGGMQKTIKTTQQLVNSQNTLYSQQQKNLNIVKQSITTQQTLGKKTKLTATQQQNLQASYKNLRNIYPTIISQSDDYRISQQQLTNASRNLTREEEALYNTRLNIAKKQVELSGLKTKNINLPGTKFSRIFLSSPQINGFIGAAQQSIRNGSWTMAKNALTKVINYYSGKGNNQLANEWSVVFNQVEKQQAMQLQMDLLTEIRSNTTPNIPNAPGRLERTASPKSFSMGTVLEKYNTDVQTLERLVDDVGRLKGAFASSMKEIQDARHSLYTDYSSDDKYLLTSLISRIGDQTIAYNDLVNTLNQAIISYDALSDEQKKNAADKIKEIEDLKKLVNEKKLIVDHLKLQKEQKEALINLNENIQSQYLDYLQLQERIARQNVELATSEEDKKIAQEAVTASIQVQIKAWQNILKSLKATSIEYAMIIEIINQLKLKLLDAPQESKFDWIGQLKDIVSPITSAFNSLGNAIGDTLVKGANFGRQMKDVWTNMTASILSNLSAMIAKMLTMLAIQGLLSAFGVPMSSTAPIVGQLFGFSDWGSLFPSGGTKSTKRYNPRTIDIIPNNNGILSKKLDRMIMAIQNFTPVQTQVIDLPTLAMSTNIGNSMILGTN